MRLWHKDLILYLPRQQLLGQWRECCAIAKSIAEKQTPNHILVNRIMEYPLAHFRNYINLVAKEMDNRGYKYNYSSCIKYISDVQSLSLTQYENEIFPYWHNDRYLKQCLYNLQEKYDCRGITTVDWKKIYVKFSKELNYDK